MAPRESYCLRPKFLRFSYSHGIITAVFTQFLLFISFLLFVEMDEGIPNCDDT